MSAGYVARLTAWIPPGAATRRFLVISFIDAVGTGLFLAGSALFFTRFLGLTTAQVGLALSLAGISGFVASVPIGWIADRIGALPTLVALHVWRGAVFCLYPFAKDFAAFVAVACLTGVGEWAVAPIVQSLVAGLKERVSQVRTMSAMTLVRNVGFTAGALLGTAAIAGNSRTLYEAIVFTDAASFFVAAILLLRLGKSTGYAQQASASVWARSGRPPEARYLLLAALNGVLYLHTVLLGVALPLWVATRTRAPAAVVGVLVVLNTALAMGMQMRLSRGGDELRPAGARQRRAGWALAVCCLLASFSGDLPPLAAVVSVMAATAALTFGEIWQSVGAWGIGYGLAPENRRTYYLSVYGLGATAATIVGPGLVTSVVLPSGTVGWLGLAAAFALVGSLVPAVIHRAATVGCPQPPRSDVEDDRDTVYEPSE